MSWAGIKEFPILFHRRINEAFQIPTKPTKFSRQRLILDESHMLLAALKHLVGNNNLFLSTKVTGMGSFCLIDQRIKSRVAVVSPVVLFIPNSSNISFRTYLTMVFREETCTKVLYAFSNSNIVQHLLRSIQ